MIKAVHASGNYGVTKKNVGGMEDLFTIADVTV
jgi:hypothetical protein